MKFYYYKITNIENGSFYIGITTDYEKRKKQHFNNLKNKTHPNYKIQKDFDLYGENAFVFEVIEELDVSEEDWWRVQWLKSTAFSMEKLQA